MGRGDLIEDFSDKSHDQSPTARAAMRQTMEASLPTARDVGRSRKHSSPNYFSVPFVIESHPGNFSGAHCKASKPSANSATRRM